MTSGIAGTARIPYGAVYFRKSNPPRADWERDYRVAAEDGFNIFRHWFIWSAIEVAPGVYDWDDYDRQLELAERHGIATIIAEMITAAPEWLYAQRPEGRLVHADGRQFESAMGASSATGGFHSMSLDDEVVRDHAGRFLTELVTRYRSHPALAGYDIWNECNYVGDSGHGLATAAKFRGWLRHKYGELATLGRTWGRHSFTDWEQINPPRSAGIYPESFDWLEFQRDNAFDLMRWRADLIRSLDPDHLITAHGVAGSLVSGVSRGADDWRSAAEVDLYGCTWVASRQGDADWQHLHAIDLTRSASRGKDFWHAEAQGGPLWLQPQVLGRRLDDGRITTPDDLRLWNLTTLCGGARGLLYPRWRPLLNGPLFGAFGAYGMDGSRTPNSEMASTIATWANSDATAALFAARPVRGEIGIVYADESQACDLLLCGNADNYTAAARGAYRAFFDNNIQADFVHIDDIAAYPAIYVPYPIMLTAEHAGVLIDWVEHGGSMIIEGVPGYFGDHGWVGTVQPGHGLDKVLGCEQETVLFTPDILRDLTIRYQDKEIPASTFRQSYRTSDGTAVGHYDTGEIAIVDSDHGQGRTRVIGSFPSIAYHAAPTAAAREFYADLLDWAGIAPRVRVDGPRVTARLFEGESDGGGGRYLWLLNQARETRSVVVRLSDGEEIGGVDVLWGDQQPEVVGTRALAVTVGRRDGLIIRLRGSR